MSALSNLSVSGTRKLSVVANVTESLTGNVMTGNGSVSVYSTRYKLEFTKTNPDTFKPGLENIFYVSDRNVNPNVTANVACWCRQVMAQAVTLRATSLFVLMQSDIVNGYQLLCDAHTVLEPHR